MKPLNDLFDEIFAEDFPEVNNKPPELQISREENDAFDEVLRDIEEEEN